MPTLEELETEAIAHALKENRGNKPKAAKDLGISLKTLYNRLNRAAGDVQSEKTRRPKEAAAALLPDPAPATSLPKVAHARDRGLLRTPHPLGMSKERAESIAQQVAINLEAGCIDVAQEEIAHGWTRHLQSLMRLSAEEILDMPVAEIGLPLKTVNALENMGVLKLRQLLEKRRETLLAGNQLGVESVKLIIEVASKWATHYRKTAEREQREAAS